MDPTTPERSIGEDRLGLLLTASTPSTTACHTLRPAGHEVKQTSPSCLPIGSFASLRIR